MREIPHYFYFKCLTRFNYCDTIIVEREKHGVLRIICCYSQHILLSDFKRRPKYFQSFQALLEVRPESLDTLAPAPLLKVRRCGKLLQTQGLQATDINQAAL